MTRWHQNGNVYWADFRPDLPKAVPPAKSQVDPGNPAEAIHGCDCGTRSLERRIDGALLDILQGHQGILRALRDHDQQAQQWKVILSAVTTELSAVRQVIQEHEDGLATRWGGYKLELAAIRERIEGMEKRGLAEASPSCSPSRGVLLKTIGGALVSLHLAAGALTGHSVLRETLGSDYDFTTTEATLERPAL